LLVLFSGKVSLRWHSAEMLHLPRSSGETFRLFSSISREAGHWIHSSPFSRICLGYSIEHGVVSVLTEISDMDGNNQEIGNCTYQHQYQKTVLVFEMKWPDLGNQFTWLCSLSTARTQLSVFTLSVYRSALLFKFCLLVVIWTRVVTSAIFPSLFSFVIREIPPSPRKLKPKCCEAAACSQTFKIRKIEVATAVTLLLFGLSNQGKWNGLQVLHKLL